MSGKKNKGEKFNSEKWRIIEGHEPFLESFNL